MCYGAQKNSANRSIKARKNGQENLNHASKKGKSTDPRDSGPEQFNATGNMFYPYRASLISNNGEYRKVGPTKGPGETRRGGERWLSVLVKRSNGSNNNRTSGDATCSYAPLVVRRKGNKGGNANGKLNSRKREGTEGKEVVKKEVKNRLRKKKKLQGH